MTQNANHVILIGTVIQTWRYGNDRFVRLQMIRPAFAPIRSDGPSDLVNVVLPEAVSRGQNIAEGDELHVLGFIRNADREVSLLSLAKGITLPDELKTIKVKHIVTEVVATDWQKISDATNRSKK
jgi:hypothetical protein